MSDSACPRCGVPLDGLEDCWRCEYDEREVEVLEEDEPR